MRFFWGPVAIILLYLMAVKVFGRRTLAAIVCIVAALFMFNGNFADVPGVYWAQLAPYSHPSDIPIGVLMPALLLLCLYYFEAEGQRANRFFFALSLLTALTVICAHFREILQILVYLGSFFIALLILRIERKRILKLLPLIAAIVGIVVIYTLFHRTVAGHVEAYDATIKADLLQQVRNFSPADFFLKPFIPLDTLLYGWTPILLVSSPIILLAFGRLRFMWLVGASIFVYLLLFRFPIFSVPYIYLTYYEVLSTPSRNVSLFIYLEAGVFLYLIAVNLARLKNKFVAGVGALVLSLGLIFVWHYRAAFEKFNYAPLFVPALLLFVGVLALYASRKTELTSKLSALALPEKIDPSWRVLLVVLVVPIVIGTALPSSSILYPGKPSDELPVPNETRVFTKPADLVTNLGCINTGNWELGHFNADLSSYGLMTPAITACPLSAGLIKWAQTELSSNAILATNSFNLYSPNLFIAQQIAVAPMVLSRHLLYVKPLFPEYYAQFDRTNALYGVQPFFNTSETLQEREQFLRALHVTHVLVDPMYYDDLKSVLDHWPDVFKPVYDDGQWIVYEISLKGASVVF